MEGQIILALIAAIIGGWLGYSNFLKRRDKESLDQAALDLSSFKERLKSLEEKLNSLESKLISETRVRELIAEDTRELKGEIKALSELISKLRVDLGVLNYISNRESAKKDT
jgi:chromosome segregation ATPase